MTEDWKTDHMPMVSDALMHHKISPYSKIMRRTTVADPRGGGGGAIYVIYI